MAKKKAAIEAVKLVEDGFVIGIGVGSTVAYAIREIGRRIKEEHLQVSAVPCSNQTSQLAMECGIPLTTFNEHLSLDLDIDGADQINGNLNLIKGMGGALTKEKIVASASKKFVIVADKTKITDVLGRNQPLPVEVLPFAMPLVSSKIESLGGRPALKKSKNSSKPFVTENGNYILNVDFGVITKPYQLDRKLKSIHGVIETGLFLGMASMAYVGTETEVKVLYKGQ